MMLRLGLCMATAALVFLAATAFDDCATAGTCLAAEGPAPDIPSAYDHSLTAEEALRADRMLTHLIGS